MNKCNRNDRKQEDREDDDVEDEVLPLVPTIRQTDSVAKRRHRSCARQKSIIVTCSENNRVQAKLRIYFRAFCVTYE